MPSSRAASSVVATPASAGRIVSIDALRGLVMFTMIFVNDLAGASNRIVPAWMKHFHGKSGMTFVDLVFPAFLFIVGMSIPFALGARLDKAQGQWRVAGHVAGRTLWLLVIGVLMVNETPDSAQMGWSGSWWCVWMFLAAILALATISPRGKAAASPGRARVYAAISWGLRAVGVAALVWLALVFRGKDGQRIVTWPPFSIHTEWYGILGLIGWAYLMGSLVFLAFRTNRTALLGCAALLMCLYPADRTGLLGDFWLSRYVGIGETLGAQASITVAGVLLASLLVAPEADALWPRVRFTLFFIGGFAAAALLLHGLYGINKNAATPSWCFWACAITAALWLLFHLAADGKAPLAGLAQPLAVAGRNVLLAYLISEMLPSAVDCLGLGDWYDGLSEPNLIHAVARSAGCGVVVLAAAVGLNRLGFRVRI
jgi:heparan-alpha-glucosaminide N-acetyltransferase